MNRNLFSNLATGVLVLCAVAVTGAVVRREFFAASTAGPDMTPREVRNWPGITSAGQWLGNPSAPVKIVEFSDFQCPFCAKTHPVIEAVRRRHPDKVAVLYRHFPLERIHPYARLAAVASECAARQERFGEYATALFAQQDSIGVKSWTRFAAESGVRDTVGFGTCVTQAQTTANVNRDLRVGTETKVEVTPTLIINGTLRPGALSEADLEKLVTELASR